MENKPTNPSKRGKSARIPPKRGQVKHKFFELAVGAVAPKNNKARMKPIPDGSVVANNACI